MTGSLSTHKYLIHTDVECVGSGSLLDHPRLILVDNSKTAIEWSIDSLDRARKLIDYEISIIKTPGCRLSFDSPYIMFVAVIIVPSTINTVESAIGWVTKELESNSNISSQIEFFVGYVISDHSEKQWPVDEYISRVIDNGF